MAEENMNGSPAEGTEGSNQESKTFTQEEVNEIVQRRLERDRKTRSGEAEGEKALQDREKALQARENALYAKELFSSNKLPDELLVLVEGRNREETDNIVKIMKPYIDRLNEPILNPVVGPTGGPIKTDRIRQAMGLTGRKV